MADALAIDVALTWAGAAGCAYYFASLYGQGHRGVGAQRFLLIVLTGLLLVRGFTWLTANAALARLTFGIATWLPLAVTLFVERVLRRHHPLGLKLLALATSLTFFGCNIVAALPARRGWLLAFLAAFALVVLTNAILLLARRRADQSAAENRLADLIVVIAVLSIPLVISDFRTLVPFSPVRLGALGALLFAYAMLGSVVRTASVASWAFRWVVLLALALGLSALISLAVFGPVPAAWWPATLRAWPVAYAWMLLTGIVVSRRAVSAGGSATAFIRWLAQAPLATTDEFIASLAASPDGATHLVLGQRDLSDYRPDVLARLADANQGVASLAVARRERGSAEGPLAESAEQWIDLLERLQMTHGVLALRATPMVVLVNLPTTTSTAAAESRLSVIQHLARRIERG